MGKRLSDLVPSVREIRRRRLGSWYYWHDRLKRYRTECTPRRALAVAAGVLAFTTFVSFALGMSKGAGIGANAAHLEDITIQLAAVLAGIAGFLFAAFIFMITIRGERAGDLRPLVAYVLKQEGMVFDAGFVVGAIGAISAVSLLSALGIQAATVPTYAICLLMGLWSLGIALWHLANMVHHSMDDIFGIIGDAIRPQVDDVLDMEVFLRSIKSEYETLLDKKELTVDPMAFYTNEKNVIKFKLDLSGMLWDVSLPHLDQLERILAPYRLDWQFMALSVPGENVSWNEVLIAIRIPNRVRPQGAASSQVNTESSFEQEACREISQEDHKTIESLVRMTFLLQPPDARVDSGFAAVVETLLNAARKAARIGDPDDLHKRLEILGDLLGAWSDRTHRLDDFFRRPAAMSLLFSGSIAVAFSPLVRSAAASKSEGTMKELGRFLCDQAWNSFKKGDRQALAGTLSLLTGMYLACIHSWDANDTNNKIINKYFDGLWLQLIADFIPPYGNRGNCRIDLIEIVVASCARVVKTGIDAGRTSDAEAFLTRLYPENEDFEYVRKSNSERSHDDQINDILDFACIGLAGWCVRRIKIPDPSNRDRVVEASLTILKLCAQRKRSADWLLGIWEWGSINWQSKSWSDIGSLRTRLGFDAWEDEDHYSERPGIITTYSPRYDWPINGLLLLMLAQVNSPTGYAVYPPVNISSEKCLDLPYATSLLKELVSVDSLKPFFGDTNRTVPAVINSIEQREMPIRKEQLKQVVEATISDAQVNAIGEGVRTTITQEAGVVGKICEIGIAESKDATACPVATLLKLDIPKQSLAEHGQPIPMDTFARFLAEKGARDLHTVLAEMVPPTPGGGAAQPDIMQAITDSCQLLELRGFQANLILAPPNAKIGKTVMEGLQVLYWPYGTATEIFIADARTAFAKSTLATAGEPSVRTSITYDTAAHQEALRKSLDAPHAQDIPLPQSIMVTLELQMTPVLCIANKDALVRAEYDVRVQPHRIKPIRSLSVQPDIKSE